MKLNLPHALVIQMLAESPTFRNHVVMNGITLTKDRTLAAVPSFRKFLKDKYDANKIDSIRYVRGIGVNDPERQKLEAIAKELGVTLSHNIGLAESKTLVERL